MKGYILKCRNIYTLRGGNMNIIVDGVKKEYRLQVEDVIYQIFKIAFPKGNRTIDEISIPSDFLEEINKEYRKEFPNIEYKLPSYSQVIGKTFNLEGHSKIILNNKHYEKGIVPKEVCLESFESQITTIYHELMHAKYYEKEYEIFKDYKDYRYPIDYILFKQSRSLYDEYNAVKKTAICFATKPHGCYINNLIKILTEEYIKINNVIAESYKENNLEKVKRTTISYVDEVKRYLSIVLAEIDALNLLIGSREEQISITDTGIEQTFMSKISLKINAKLKEVDEIPNEEDIVEMGGYIKEIYNKIGVNWYELGEGEHIYLTKQLNIMENS